MITVSIEAVRLLLGGLCFSPAIVDAFGGDELEGEKEETRDDDDVVEMAKNGDEIRDKVNRQQDVADRQPQQHPRQPPHTRIAQDQPVDGKLLLELATKFLQTIPHGSSHLFAASPQGHLREPRREEYGPGVAKGLDATGGVDMKNVLGVSLGDSARDFEASVELLGHDVNLRRVGTDGDIDRYVELLKENDGKVDAFGFGGFDVYVRSAGRKYAFRASKKILRGIEKTPVLDGSGVKNTLERAAIVYLQEKGIVDFAGTNSLLVCGVDRFGMAEALAAQGGPVVYGDLMFGLGIPIAFRSLGTLRFAARLILPIAVQLPIDWLYPTGDKQKQIVPKFGKYYAWADNVCGDGHYIRRHVPGDMTGKTIITNTTTKKDVELYRERGVTRLVTTTPSFNGRSPGTNIFEAAIVAAMEKDPAEITDEDYDQVLNEIGWKPTITELDGDTQ